MLSSVFGMYYSDERRTKNPGEACTNEARKLRGEDPGGLTAVHWFWVQSIWIHDSSSFATCTYGSRNAMSKMPKFFWALVEICAFCFPELNMELLNKKTTSCWGRSSSGCHRSTWAQHEPQHRGFDTESWSIRWWQIERKRGLDHTGPWMKGAGFGSEEGGGGVFGLGKNSRRMYLEICTRSIPHSRSETSGK